MTMKNTLLQPEGWVTPKGYANGIVATGTRWLFIAGQVGWNAHQEFETDDFVGQVEQALRNVVGVLAAAEASPEAIVRMTWYVTDRAAYLSSLKEIGRVYRATIGRHFPAMTAVEVAALVEDGALVEIEVTAVLP